SSLDIMELRVIGGQSGTGLSVSPDGRWVAFEIHQAKLESDSYRSAWYIASTSNVRQATNVGDAGDPILFQQVDPNNGLNTGAWVPDKAVWSADSRRIFYRRRAEGQTQIWTSTRDGSEQVRLTDCPADVDRIVASDDRSRLFFETGIARDLRR